MTLASTTPVTLPRAPLHTARHRRHALPRRLRQLCGVALLVLLAACGSRAEARLTITGSTSMTPFVEHLAESYQRAHPGTRIDVQGLGSSAGIRAASDGISELGMSSRALDADEAAQLTQVVMARDALAVIVHPDNPVRELTRAQIHDIFAGLITSWEALGGLPEPIIVVSREAGSGTYSAFEELVMEGEPIAPAALRQGSNGAVRQIVADAANAIGYISLGIVDSTVHPVTIDGTAPSVAEVERGTYQLVRPFLIVWRKDRALSPTAAAFLDYIRSPEGQAELAQSGLVPGERGQP